jgi:peptidoglycan/xylan/chitin deacetylase (PgdA/CDA1 family)
VSAISSGPRVAVLGYHKIGPPPEEWWSWQYVPGDVFAHQIGYLREEGWEPLTAGDLVRGLDSPESLPERSFLVTFDDAYLSLRDGAVEQLDRLEVPGVVFAPTDLVGGWNSFDDQIEPREDICDWDTLRTFETHRVSVQSHGVSHRGFSTLTPDEQAREARESKRVLERELGGAVELFAYPYGEAGRPDVLSQAGYRAGFGYGGGPFSVPPGDPYLLPRLAMGPDTELREELAP